MTFHKLSDTTSRVTVQIDWEPTGILEKLGGLLGIDNRAIKKDLKNFKQYIETKGSADGAWARRRHRLNLELLPERPSIEDPRGQDGQ